MRVGIIYCDVDAPSRHLRLVEIGILGEMLNQAHHETAATLAAWFDHPEDVLSRLGSPPDAFVFFLDELNWPLAATLAQQLRSTLGDATFIAAGQYSVLAPDAIVKAETFDYLVVGECEVALFELLSSLERRLDVSQIRNLWWRRSDGSIVRNPLRPLIESLDTLPLPDRTLLDSDWLRMPGDRPLYIMASRGCPFECLFCYSPMSARAYAGKGQYFRSRMPASVAGEFLGELRRKSYSRVVFVDEMFPTDKTWLRSFAQHLRRADLPPWEATVAVEKIDSEVVDLLAEAGCRRIHLGVETGNEAFRKRLAGRNLSNAALATLVHKAHERRITVAAHVMIGLPLESSVLARETLEFLRATGFDEIACAVYQPIDKTPLGEYCRPKIAESSSAALPRRVPKTLPSGRFGELDLEEVRSLVQRLSLLEAPQQIAGLPSASADVRVDFIRGLSDAHVAIGKQNGLVDLKILPTGEDIAAAVEMRPSVAIRFPESQLPEHSVLRFHLGMPERSELYLRATSQKAVFRVMARSDVGEESKLFEKEFDGRGESLASCWRELLISLPRGPGAWSFSFHLDGGETEDEEIVVWVGDPVILEQAAIVHSRQAEERLRSDLTREIEVLRHRIGELETQLAESMGREQQLRQELAQKAKRISDLQLQILELEKLCEELRVRLTRSAPSSPGFPLHRFVQKLFRRR